jgi:hypothetical protein
MQHNLYKKQFIYSFLFFLYLSKSLLIIALSYYKSVICEVMLEAAETEIIILSDSHLNN